MSNSSEFMECCGEVVSWTKWGDGNHGMVHKIRRVSNGKTTWPNYVGISWVLPSCEFVGLWEYQTWTKSRLPSETEWREHRENHVYWTSSHISSAHHQLQASSEIHNCFSHILSHIGDPSVHCKVCEDAFHFSCELFVTFSLDSTTGFSSQFPFNCF